MKKGEHVQATKAVIGLKKTVYALNASLLTIVSVDFFPVLIVTRYGETDKFPLHVSDTTTELHPKCKAHIQKDIKNKTVTKWQ